MRGILRQKDFQANTLEMCMFQLNEFLNADWKVVNVETVETKPPRLNPQDTERDTLEFEGLVTVRLWYK